MLGGSLRVRVSVDIQKPIRRGVKVNLEGSMRGVWIPIKYEWLTDFCYICGRLGHTEKGCEGVYTRPKGLSGVKGQYGWWLRYIGA